MHQHSLGDVALQRLAELRADADHARLVAQSQRSRGRRVSGRVRVARALRALGYFLLDAGHSLEPGSWRSV
ncbi:MAG TPA: hypothetical protein VGW96_05205 [Candidatus Eremiobacteraceae bacterium]|nr:hypothetical protein [Candidatus Eremiobacteraceae bacterium]